MSRMREKCQQNIHTKVAVVIAAVVFVVGCRKLTICSVMELRRFRILQNPCNRHFGISRLLKFLSHQHFSPSSSFPSLFRFVPSSIYTSLLVFFFFFFKVSEVFVSFSHWRAHTRTHIPTKWIEQKIFKSSFDNFSFQSQLMGQHISLPFFPSMGQFFLVFFGTFETCAFGIVSCVRYTYGNDFFPFYSLL